MMFKAIFTLGSLAMHFVCGGFIEGYVLCTSDVVSF